MFLEQVTRRKSKRLLQRRKREDNETIVFNKLLWEKDCQGRKQHIFRNARNATCAPQTLKNLLGGVPPDEDGSRMSFWKERKANENGKQTQFYRKLVPCFKFRMDGVNQHVCSASASLCTAPQFILQPPCLPTSPTPLLASLSSFQWIFRGEVWEKHVPSPTSWFTECVFKLLYLLPQKVVVTNRWPSSSYKQQEPAEAIQTKTTQNRVLGDAWDLREGSVDWLEMV